MYTVKNNKFFWIRINSSPNKWQSIVELTKPDILSPIPPN